MSTLRARPGFVLPALLLLALACSRQGPDLSATSPSTASGGPVQAQPAPISPPAAESTPRSALYTPAEPPPKVDTGIASVALDDVVFDTFRGGYIPLSQATDEEVEELRDSINPIYEPRYGSAESGEWLRDADLVIGYVSQDDAYAYPVKMLNLHEIVNDFIDGVPVLVSYCPLCASAVVYSRELDGQVLLFGNTSALHESDMVMYDHRTGSYWFQVLGEAIVGPRGSPCFHR